MYNIMVGKIAKNGTGDVDSIVNVMPIESELDAKMFFAQQVSYEVKHIKEWHLTTYQHVEVWLVDVSDKDNPMNVVDVARINSRGWIL